MGVTGPTAPPGWYPHPSMAGTQQYWDGARWTNHIAPAMPQWRPAQGPDAEATERLETWGWVGAFIFPIVGIVIGIVLLTRPGKNAGGWILGISAGWILLAWIFFAMLAAQPTTY
jgi:hypothetical protein